MSDARSLLEERKFKQKMKELKHGKVKKISVRVPMDVYEYLKNMPDAGSVTDAIKKVAQFAKDRKYDGKRPVFLDGFNERLTKTQKQLDDMTAECDQHIPDLLKRIEELEKKDKENTSRLYALKEWRDTHKDWHEQRRLAEIERGNNKR